MFIDRSSYELPNSDMTSQKQNTTTNEGTRGLFPQRQDEPATDGTATALS